MSGWIKYRCDLQRDPAVMRLSRITKLDRFSVLGRLAEFWAWADQHAVDGRVAGAGAEEVDDVVECDGFALALRDVGWLEIDSAGLKLPKHERHNGTSAKERVMKNARQARWREGARGDDPPQPSDDAGDDTSVDGGASTEASTRGDKRRGEKKKEPPEDKPPVVRARTRVTTRPAKKAPDGFEVTSEMREWAASDAPGIDIDRETAKFRDHTFSSPRADWPATWRNWMRRASEGALFGTQRRRPSTATERGASVMGYIEQFAAAKGKSSTATADEVMGLADIDEFGASPFEKPRELPYVDRIF